jgi:hypothetical protein
MNGKATAIDEAYYSYNNDNIISDLINTIATSIPNEQKLLGV